MFTSQVLISKQAEGMAFLISACNDSQLAFQLQADLSTGWLQNGPHPLRQVGMMRQTYGSQADMQRSITFSNSGKRE